MPSDHLPTGDMTAGEAPSGDGSFSLGAEALAAPGDRVGPYRILETIGQGGFGVVYLAERREPMVQRVALKVIKPGMDSRAVIARFEQERQALAVMDHPNVARVFDGGMTPAGRPYFAMEYVSGDAITEYCDRHGLSVRERLELFTHVCGAVQHAHMKGIIHRDLKPTNVLVSVQDGRPVAKVIDFGVAKAISHALTEKTIFTETGQLVGTLEYMSPEQAEGGRVDIDTRSDVYSLGVMLYELLTGLLPFDTRDLRSKGYAEVQRVIRESEPPRPSTRLRSVDGESGARIAKARQVGHDRLWGELKRELEWIPLKAMRKDRARRYASAEGLASDIRRYLEGRPLEAAPESRAYLARKFLARNRASATATALVVVALAAGFGTALVQRNEALRQRQNAEDNAQTASRNEAEALRQRTLADEHAAAEGRARKRAETISQFVTSALRSGDPNNVGGSQATTILDAMGSAVRDINGGRFRDDPETDAELRTTIAKILKGNGRIAEAEPLFTAAHELQRRMHPGDHPDVAMSLAELASVREALGRAVEAEPLYVEALAMRQRLFKGDCEEIAQSLNDLAYVRDTLGQVREAEAMYVQALEMRRRLASGDGAPLATSINNLAYVRDELGKLAEAEALYVEALAMNRRLYRGDHPEIASSLGNLGSLLNEMGRTAEAEPLYVETLEMNQRLFRGDHPDVARSLNNLAYLRDVLGRLGEAEPLYEQALAMRRRLFPGDHPDVATSLANLASVRRAMGRDAEAESLFREALAMRQRLFPGDHPDLALSLANLAVCLESLDRNAEAEQLYVQALAMRERLCKGDHDDVATALSRLAAVRMAMGRDADAEPLLARALAMRQRLHAGDFPSVAMSLNNLASVRCALGRGGEAVSLAEQSVAMAERLLPADHPNLARYRETLAKCRAATAK